MHFKELENNQDQRKGSASKGACSQAQQPEFDPWDTHYKMKEFIPSNYHIISTQMHTSPHTYINTQK